MQDDFLGEKGNATFYYMQTCLISVKVVIFSVSQLNVEYIERVSAGHRNVATPRIEI